MLFSTQDVTWLRTLAGEALTDSCDILRKPTRTSDSQGGKNTFTWQVAATSPCAVIDGRGRPGEPYVNAQLRGRLPKAILFPANTDVRDSDRVRVNGTVYYEVLVGDSSNTPEIVSEAIVVRLGQGAR